MIGLERNLQIQERYIQYRILECHREDLRAAWTSMINIHEVDNTFEAQAIEKFMKVQAERAVVGMMQICRQLGLSFESELDRV